MKHISVRMRDYPIEFLDITPINPLISKCQIKVCYVGQSPNRNGTVITKEVATEMANSLPGSPIVGYYNEKNGDFEEHNRDFEIVDGKFEIKDTTRPYGFVDLNAKVWFAKYLDDDSMEHEYLMTEGWLWTGQYPEAKRILENGNNQSMELDENSVAGNWTKDENGYPQFFIINEAIISKLCVLGEDFEPCFEGANITSPVIQFSFSKNFEAKMYSMMTELKNYMNEGGKEMDTLEKEKLENQDNSDEMNQNNTENTLEDNTSEQENLEVETVSTVAEVEEATTENVESEEVTEDEAEVKNEDTTETPEEVEPETEAASYSLEEIPEYVELKAEYEKLQADYSALKDAKEALESEVTPLKEFKLAADKKEKEEMIASFYMLSDEDKQDVVSNIDNYSLNDIEAKLSILCVRNKVNFNLDDEIEEEKKSTTYNLESSEDDSIPAWVKAVMEVEKELN